MTDPHKHETKICPRCGNKFECKLGDILHCQCYSVQLTPEQRLILAEQYEDCLCASCMIALTQGSKPEPGTMNQKNSL